MKTDKVIDLGEIVHKALTLYSENAVLFLQVAACACSLATVQAILRSTGISFLGSVASMLLPVSFAVNVLFLMALYVLISKASSGASSSLGTALSEVWPKYWSGLAVYFSFVMAAGAGFILFILPGIYIGVMFCMVLFATFFEDKGIIEAWKRSHELVKKNVKTVILAHLLMMLLAVLVLVCMYVANVIVGIPAFITAIFGGAMTTVFFPLIASFYYFLYQELKTSQDSSVTIAVYNKS
jgi:hypothetical protein